MWGIYGSDMAKKTKSIKQWPASLQHQPRVEAPAVPLSLEVQPVVAAPAALATNIDVVKKPKLPKVRKPETENEASDSAGHAAERAKVKARLSRVAGQIAGIQKMVDEDRYCMDILTQIAAARAALDRAGLELLTAHIGGCLTGHGDAGSHPDSAEQTQVELLDEVRKVITRFLG